MEDTKEKKYKWLSDYIIVFTIPLIAYLLIYVYEIGYTGYFGIPIEFIKIDISKILTILGNSFITLFTLFITIELLYILLHKIENPILNELKQLNPVIIITLSTLFIYGKHWEKAIPSIIVLVFFICLTFLFPLITQRDKKTYKEKLEAQAIIESKSHSLIKVFISNIGNNGRIFILTMVFVISFCINSGTANAMNKQYFISLLNYPNTIVLCKYGDNFICTKIDNTKKHITKEFFIINIYEPSNIYTKTKLIDYTVKE